MEWNGDLDDDGRWNENTQQPNQQNCEQFNALGVCVCRENCNLIGVKRVQDLMALFRSSIREEVEEAVKRAIMPLLPSLQASALPSASRSSRHLAEPSVSRSLQLHFVGPLPETLYTLTNIKDEVASLIVELCDDSGSKVEVGPESSVKIKFVVLDGDFEVEDRENWTEDDFYKSVVQPRKGKGPLLVGDYEISMNKGVAVVSNIAFTDNSKSMRNGKFRLGALVVKGLPPGVVVKGAVSNAFKVKERRLQAARKDKTPRLEDGVGCLPRIGTTGATRERLRDAGVNTVKDFLELYHTDARRLQDILRVTRNWWPKVVEHARSCSLINEYYTYYDDTEGVHLLLNCVFDIVSVTFKDQISRTYEYLDHSQKELVNKLRLIAYEKRSELPKTTAPFNQTFSCAETAFPSSFPNVMMLEPATADRGERTVGVNSLGPVLYSFQHEDRYQSNAPTGAMQDVNPNPWDIDIWNSPMFTSNLLEGDVIFETPTNEEEGDVIFEAPTNDNVTSKLKAVCCVTKAALIFMISIQQDPTPQKKRKLQ